MEDTLQVFRDAEFLQTLVNNLDGKTKEVYENKLKELRLEKEHKIKRLEKEREERWKKSRTQMHQKLETVSRIIAGIWITGFLLYLGFLFLTAKYDPFNLLENKTLTFEFYYSTSSISLLTCGVLTVIVMILTIEKF